MNLSKAVVLRRQPIETPVRALAHFDVVTLRPDDFVSSALVLMTKQNKRRVAVHDGERYVGILEDIDLLGFLAGSAQVVAGRIDRASSQDDLMIAARNRGAGPHLAPAGRQGRGDWRSRLRPQWAAVLPAVRDGRTRGDPDQWL